MDCCWRAKDKIILLRLLPGLLSPNPIQFPVF
jgi:hypothetical protein